MFGLNLGNLVTHLLADTTQYVRGMQIASATLDRFSAKAMRVGRQMSTYITAPLALIGGASVRAFGNFDDAMTKSLAIMGDVNEEIRGQMEQTAMQIAGDSVTAPRELAQAYYYLASAGLNASQSMEALGAVEKFAVAGAFDMAQATDLLTDAQSALGLTVANSTQNMMNMTHIGDVLVKANTLANASVEQFSRALTNRAAAAIRLLNKDVEEGVAVLASFADQGVKGEMAGERLAIVLRDLQRASLSDAEAWREMGLSVYDATGTMLPLADIIGQLETAFGTMSDQQKKAAAQMLGFQDRSFSALQTLLGTSQKIRQYESALRQAGGTTENVATKQLQSFNAQMKILWNRVTLAAIEIGSVLAPWITKLGGYLDDALTWFRNLDDSTKKWVVGLGLVAAAAGPLIIALGLLATGISTIISLAPVAAFMAAAAGVWMFVDSVTEADLGISKWVSNIRIGGHKISSYMQYAASYVWEVWENTLNILGTAWLYWRNVALDAAGAVWRGMLNVAKFISDVFWGVIRGLALAFKDLAKSSLKIGGILGVIDVVDAANMGIALDRMTDGVKNYAKSIEDVYNGKIADSLDASETRQQKYVESMDKLNRDYTENAKTWAQVREDIWAEDAANIVAEQGKVAMESQSVSGSTEAAKMLGSKMQAGVGVGSAGGVGGGVFSSEGSFREISLRRLSIAQSAPTRKQKQNVEDELVAGKIDELKQALTNRRAATAILG